MNEALSRQQRRQEARRLMELGRKALARGLPERPAQDAVVGVGLVLRGKLEEKQNPARASEAAAMAEQLLDKSIAQIEKDPAIACRRGCWHCCVTVASVSPPEIFRVAGWLKANRMRSATLAAEAVIARCKAKQGPSIAAMFQQKVPCPALVEGECGVHPARPINCRQFFSLSVEACKRKFGAGEGEVPFVGAAIDRGVLVRCLLLAAARSAGLSDATYELSGALEAALAQDRAEARWLAGEDVFAGALVTQRPPATQATIERLARLISASAP